MPAPTIDAPNVCGPAALASPASSQSPGPDASPAQVLVLGLGNGLLGDDAAGPRVIAAFADQPMPPDRTVRWRDGGTLGLSLLPEIEAADALLVVDAAYFGAVPGTVRRFDGTEMDAQLGGRKRSAHELALADLLGAAALVGRLPPRRVLVAVEPASTALGLELSPEVARAFPRLCDEVRAALDEWTGATAERPAAARSLEECVHEH